MEYNRPRERVRAFSFGFVTGTASSDPNMLDKIQSNLQFRINSAREMVMGLGTQDAIGPGERRMEVFRRTRADLLGGGQEQQDSEPQESSRSTSSSMVTDRSKGGTTTTGTTSVSKSGSIGEQSRDNDASSQSSAAGVPSMSEVDKGTRARAMDRGYQG